MAIYTDGADLPAGRPVGTPSTPGNRLGGSFTLGLLGYSTAPIAFNAADTDVKAALEFYLPNLGTVAVSEPACCLLCLRLLPLTLVECSTFNL